MRRFFRTSSLSWLFLLLFLALPLQAQASLVPADPQTSYSVVGKPTISAHFIDQVLSAYQSPAAGTGQYLYAQGVRYNIDPVYALAFFMHESSFGRVGVAISTYSLGNLRCIAGVPCHDGYAAFPSWEAGYDAWYNLLSTLYINKWNLTSVDQIIPRYAPAADNNDEGAYIAAIKNAVDTWRSQQINVPGPVTPSMPPDNGASHNPTFTPAQTTSIPADTYRVLGKPTISAGFIDRILADYHSPAAGKGQALYDAGVKYGIDPAFALAFFMRDSIFGTVGMARVTHSLGRIPVPADAQCRCQMLNGYRSYERWEDSFTDWYRLVREQYVDRQQLTSVNQVVVALSTTTDPDLLRRSIRTIEHRIDLWRDQQQHNATEDKP